MKVVQKHYQDNENYEAEHLEINIDGKSLASFNCQIDCPEDNNLSRNFSDCFKIVDLMKLAYIAGKNGEELDLVRQEFDYSEL